MSHIAQGVNEKELYMKSFHKTPLRPFCESTRLIRREIETG